MGNLVIVESPAKAKTIQKYLGKDYTVEASMGHVRDLPKSKLGVDVDHNFEPQYVEMDDKKDVIQKLRRAAKESDKVYLATDPDREGEAISWHLAQLLDLDINDNNRVEFNEITKAGVKAGMASPHKINLDLVNAQQARRILDRLVGYNLSPFLWKKVRRGLSAGRVQSVAVRLIVDRENEIRAFQPVEYWSIDAQCTASPSKTAFPAQLVQVDGNTLDKLDIHDKAQADALVQRLETAAFHVSSVKKKDVSRKPMPPYITSTLQQDAAHRLGFSASRTMSVAQELYEGIDVKGLGATGLITYMRTDSLRISDEAAQSAEKFIREHYGASYLPSSRRVYKSRKNAQDAHEAIRPSLPELSPDEIRSSLTADQYKIYNLIWRRFMASQMADAKYKTMSVEISGAGCILKSSGSHIAFDGYQKLYGATDDEKKLPDLQEGQSIHIQEICGNQHFTQPPARYNEASLIKTLEERGIGRPSTYAPTISTIVNHQYVERDGKQLKPTALGETVTQVLEENFPNIMDPTFTADMENNLDEIERGNQEWTQTLDTFYKDFSKSLTEAEERMKDKRVKVPDEPTNEVCELCGKPMVIKIGKYGKFMACSGFPECKNTKQITETMPGKCPKCGGKIVKRKTKRGRTFYGCGNYPDCDFRTWSVPTEQVCPRCGKTLFRESAKSETVKCENPDCGYRGTLEADQT